MDPHCQDVEMWWIHIFSVCSGLTHPIYTNSEINQLFILEKPRFGINSDFLKSTVENSHNCFIKRNHYLIFSSDGIFSIGQTTEIFRKNPQSRIVRKLF